MKRRSIMTMLAVVACFASGSVWAQPPNDPQESGKKVVVPQTPENNFPQVPDPTQPGPQLKDLLGKGKNESTYRMPLLALKGRVLQRGKDPVALLEVDGKLAVVSKNSIIATGSGLSLKVTEISAADVRIEVQPSLERIVLR